MNKLKKNKSRMKQETKTAMTIREIADRFNELALHEKWFEIH